MLQGGPVTLIDIPFEVYATKFGEFMPTARVLVWTRLRWCVQHHLA